MTFSDYSRLGLLLGFSLLFACSSDPIVPQTDQTQNNAETGVDAGSDVPDDTGNVSNSDTDTSTTPGDVVGTDGDVSTGPPIVPCETDEEGETSYYEPGTLSVPGGIQGCIGLPDEAYFDPDSDYYNFEGEAGTVLRINLDSYGDDLVPIIAVQYVGEDEAGAGFYRQLDEETPNFTRELFLPYDGTYEIQVNDLQNLIYLYYYEGDPVGGSVDFEYEISLELETFSAPGELMPFEQTYDNLPAGNGVRVYDFTAFEAGVFIAEVIAQGAETPSELDAVLLLMNADYTEVFAENEDAHADPENSDPYLLHLIEENDRVRLVVDFILARENNTHSLSVSIVDPSKEREPNDSNTSAWPLPIAEEGEGNAGIDASFKEPTPSNEVNDPSDVPDLDWFALGDIEAGEAVEIVLTVPDGSTAEPAVIIGVVTTGYFGPSFDGLWYSEMGPDGLTRIEATAWTDGDYFAVAVDRRNLTPPDAGEGFVLEGVGGPGFDYNIKATVFERIVTPQSLPISLETTLSQNGEIDWFSFATPASEDDDDDVTQFMIASIAMDEDEAGPTVYLFDRTEYDEDYEISETPAAVGYLSNSTIEGVLVTEVSNDTQYGLAVWNYGPWPAVSLDYGLELQVATLPEIPEPTMEEDDFGSDLDSAETATNDSAWVALTNGESPDDSDHDIFAIELDAGDLLIAYTASPGGAQRQYECGDGFLDWEETCDDGNTEDGDNCAADCMTPEEDIESICGDGMASGLEICDEGDDNSDSPWASCNTECVTTRTADTFMTLTGPGIDNEDGLTDDDGGAGVFSRLVYRVPTDGAGTYFVDISPFCAGGFDDFDPYCSEGAYLLHLVVF